MRISAKSFLLYCMTAALLLCTGCVFFSSTEKCDFAISNAVTADYWIVSCYDGNREISFCSDGTAFSLELPKNTSVGVLAYPVVNGNKMLPYGTIYPHGSILTKRRGFSALTIDRLYRLSESGAQISQDYISRFNWQQFMDECEKCGDPWQIDGERILKAIAAGSFKKSDLKVPKKAD
ncbi:MAG: hypothetical protein J5930_03845 [Treponema sp.]|nr:hypothetical protein [Treponema sp.]